MDIDKYKINKNKKTPSVYTCVKVAKLAKFANYDFA